MKHLKRFENFAQDDMGRFSDVDSDEQDWLTHIKKEDEMEEEEDEMEEEEEDGLEAEFHEDEEMEDEEEEEEEHIHRRKVWGDEVIERKKFLSFKDSGLKNPKKADLNKDKKISGYEKARGKAIEKSKKK